MGPSLVYRVGMFFMTREESLSLAVAPQSQFIDASSYFFPGTGRLDLVPKQSFLQPITLPNQHRDFILYFSLSDRFKLFLVFQFFSLHITFHLDRSHSILKELAAWIHNSSRPCGVLRRREARPHTYPFERSTQGSTLIR